MTNSSTKKTALYAVLIAVKTTPYLYWFESQNHDEAWQEAVREHRRQNHPLPVGTHGWVDGPCALDDCKCGKNRRREYIVMAEPALC